VQTTIKFIFHFWADRQAVNLKVGPLSWLSSVCLSDRLSDRLSICHGCIVAKRCKIEPRLLLITNRKSHTGFRMTYKSSTLDDHQGQWQPVRSVPPYSDSWNSCSSTSTFMVTIRRSKLYRQTDGRTDRQTIQSGNTALRIVCTILFQKRTKLLNNVMTAYSESEHSAYSCFSRKYSRRRGATAWHVS